MAVKYDLSALAPAGRVRITSALDELGIMYNYLNEQLTVDESNEDVVDEVVGSSERIESAISAIEESQANQYSGRSPFSCELCGAVPAALLTLRRQVGLVVVAQTYSVDALLCQACGESVYKDFQKQTALKGWTGVRSALMNPVVLGTNANNIKRHRETIHQLKREYNL